MAKNIADLALATGPAQDLVFVDKFTHGLVGPGQKMVGPVKNGGKIVSKTPPGCWSPMITPSFHGGHEVTVPVAVEGAEVGDAVIFRITKCRAASNASSSGVDSFLEGRYTGDPFVAKKCPNCGTESPDSFIEGIGPEAIKCKECGAEASPFRFTHGYTVVMDRENGVAITVPQDVADKVAGNAKALHASPDTTEANPILVYAAADMPGVITRVIPFMGNMGTTPSTDMPDSHNAGDFGSFLIDAPHEYGLTREQLYENKTDATWIARRCARAQS
jgi:acetamidase/formamidase